MVNAIYHPGYHSYPLDVILGRVLITLTIRKLPCKSEWMIKSTHASCSCPDSNPQQWWLILLMSTRRPLSHRGHLSKPNELAKKSELCSPFKRERDATRQAALHRQKVPLGRGVVGGQGRAGGTGPTLERWGREPVGPP